MLGIRTDFNNRQAVPVAHLSAECLRLRNGPRISVEDKPLATVVTLNAIGNDTIHNGIADEFTRIHFGLRFAAKRRFVSDCFAQHVAG